MKPLARLPLCDPVLVTVTVTAPTLPAGVVAVMVVLLTTTTLVAAVAAELHRRAGGEVGPGDGHRCPARRRTVVRAHAGHRRRTDIGVTRRPGCRSARPLSLSPSPRPQLPAGVVAVMVVLFTTTTFVAAVLAEGHRRARWRSSFP